MFVTTMPRRALLAGLAAVPVAVLAACSKDKPKPPATSSTSSSSSTTTTAAPPKPQASGKGLPADLLGVMTAMYVGGKVPASGTVAAALAKRKPAGKSVTVAGSTGTWHKTPIAVVTQGKDVTLLVKGKAWSVVGGWWPSMGVARPAFKAMHVLTIGSDARAKQAVEKCRGDSLHIIGVDTKGVGGILGIPRDSWVPISTGGTSKINSALTFGGAKGQWHTVRNTTGIPLDGYVITGFKGFRDMVTAVGGIALVYHGSLKDDKGMKIVRPGLNHLNRTTALAFARERHHLPNGDFGRSLNQGRLIQAGMAMAARSGPGTLPKYLTKIWPHVSTNLGVEQVLNACASLYLTNAAKVPNKVVPGAIGTRGGGQSVVLLGGAARADFRDMKDGRLRA
ncbi:MAG TPA: LCP family protein [Pedococcus sp.]|nr:LCP family protein [Pedococcus sp.]